MKLKNIIGIIGVASVFGTMLSATSEHPVWTPVGYALALIVILIVTLLGIAYADNHEKTDRSNKENRLANRDRALIRMFNPDKKSRSTLNRL